MDKQTQLDEWAQQAIVKWLDSSGQVSIQMVQEKQWLASPFPDMLNVMEAEWLANAIQMTGIHEAVGIAFEYNRKPDVDMISVTQDALLDFNGHNSWRALMLTSPSEDFLYYKDEANRYYLLCGEKEFVLRAHPCSLQTSKKMYDEWVDGDHHNQEEQRFLMEVWNRYTR